MSLNAIQATAGILTAGDLIEATLSLGVSQDPSTAMAIALATGIRLAESEPETAEAVAGGLEALLGNPDKTIDSSAISGIASKMYANYVEQVSRVTGDGDPLFEAANAQLRGLGL